MVSWGRIRSGVRITGRMVETVIKPKGRFGLGLKELWDYRELFYFLAWRDIKIRYKQTLFGVAWAILQPFLTMVVFSIFFGRVVGDQTGGVPYPIFSYAGLLFWQFFSGSVTKASGSFVGNSNMVQKIYFPRLILPVSSTLVSFIDFAAAALIFVGLMVYYKIAPGVLGLAIFIPAIFISFMAANGLGIFFATLNVRYRDVQHALPFFVQLLLFLTPVIYPISVVPERFRWILSLNPMSGVIENLRAGLLGTGSVNWSALGWSALISIALFVFGYLYLKRFEGEFADII